MNEFEKYILDNHPDPDILVADTIVFDQMCKLAENYAQSKVKNLGLFDVIGSLRTCQTGCGGIVFNKICNSCGAKW